MKITSAEPSEHPGDARHRLPLESGHPPVFVRVLPGEIHHELFVREHGASLANRGCKLRQLGRLHRVYLNGALAFQNRKHISDVLA
jgi:hypothetical protein